MTLQLHCAGELEPKIARGPVLGLCCPKHHHMNLIQSTLQRLCVWSGFGQKMAGDVFNGDTRTYRWPACEGG